MDFNKTYWIFFGLIITSIVSTQLVIQYALFQQRKDARVINISGRQRMLSQNICKTGLLILNKARRQESFLDEQKKLSVLLADWKEKHYGLIYRKPQLGLDGENSSLVEGLYNSIQNSYKLMYKSGIEIVSAQDSSYIEENVSRLLEHELSFLSIMDDIVFQYDKEANNKLNRLETIELGIGFFTFFTILLEVMFIFNPMIRRLLYQNKTLEKRNEDLRNRNEEINNKKLKINLQNQELELKTQQLLVAKEKAEAIALAKANFLSNMSHEIRTPLNGIMGITNILLEEDPTQEQIEHLNTLNFSTQNLLAIINDILDYSKIEAGRLTLEHQNFNLRKTINEIFKSLGTLAKKKFLQFRLNYDSAIPDHLVGDSVRLTQILTNLLGNGIKFTEKGFVGLEASLLQIEHNEALIYFSVDDSGIGIPKQKQELIFDSFSQADSNTTRLYGGTGLGLAISRKLLELKGSHINLKSEVNKGSKFYFTLSYPIGEAPEKSIDMDRKSIRSLTFKGAKKVLLVDDNHLNLTVAKRFLKYWDLEFDVAYNGKEAIGLISNNDYSVVLMDLQMPIMDGFTAVETVRSWEAPKYQILPIIALSASAIAELREKALHIGMNDFLLKPYQPQELYLTLERHLQYN